MNVIQVHIFKAQKTQIRKLHYITHNKICVIYAISITDHQSEEEDDSTEDDSTECDVISDLYDFVDPLTNYVVVCTFSI